MAREHQDQLLTFLPLLAFALLAVLSEATGLDRRLSDAWYDPARGFSFKHSWWAEDLAGLLLGFGLGTLFGFGQIVRGAHFQSHNLWSAALCWAVATALYWGAFRGDLSAASRSRGKAGGTAKA